MLAAALIALSISPQNYVSGAALPARQRYEPFVRQQIGTRLRDAESARFEFAEPRQVTCRARLFRTPQRWQGWAVTVRVNARNAYGGYTGFESFEVLMVNNGSEDGIEVYQAASYRFAGCQNENWSSAPGPSDPPLLPPLPLPPPDELQKAKEPA